MSKFIYLKYFFISFILSIIITPIIIKFSQKYKLFDTPNARKIHSKPISRLGGIAIFIAFIIPFTYFINKENNKVNFNEFIYIISITLAFLIGFIDDLKNIKARYKLMLQIIIAFISSLSGLRITEFTLLKLFTLNFGYFSYPITIIWILVFMNAVNLIDGMDGLASGIIGLASIFLFIIGILMKIKIVSFISIILLGSILGFYIFNFPPAKIFMGDGGAYFLGFVYSTLGLMGIKKSSIASLFIVPIVLLLIPLIDILGVIFRRIKERKNIFSADMNHLHHKMLNFGLKSKSILFIIYLFTIIMGFFSILIVLLPPEYSFTLFALLLSIIFLAFYIIFMLDKYIQKKNTN